VKEGHVGKGRRQRLRCFAIAVGNSERSNLQKNAKKNPTPAPFVNFVLSSDRKWEVKGRRYWWV